MIEPAITRCQQLAAAGKRRIDRDNWTWPKKKRKKILSDENHAGEYYMVIPRKVNF